MNKRQINLTGVEKSGEPLELLVIWSYFVVEEADLQDVLHVLHSVGHVQIPQRVAQQEHVRTCPQLLEVACVEQGAFSLVVDVDQLSLEVLEHSLRNRWVKKKISFLPQHTAEEFLPGATHSFVKVHIVGDNFDIGMEHARLVDDLFQNISNAGGEDEQRNAVLMQVVEEELVTLPVEERG